MGPSACTGQLSWAGAMSQQFDIVPGEEGERGRKEGRGREGGKGEGGKGREGGRAEVGG